MDHDQTPPHGYLQVDASGKTPAKWQDLRQKFVEMIHNTLDQITKGQGGAWFEDQAATFSKALLDYAKAKLARPGVENEKILAEVGSIYADRELKIAETRKVHAEADATELETNTKRLRLAMRGMKALLIGEEGEEAIVFGQQIDAFLAALDEAADERPADPSLPS